MRVLTAGILLLAAVLAALVAVWRPTIGAALLVGVFVGWAVVARTARATRDASLDRTGIPDAQDAVAPSPSPVAQPSPVPEDRVAISVAATSTPAPRSKLDADVIIIGGGPGGAVLGAHLAKLGVDHLIVDQPSAGRRLVAESLACAAVRALEEVGFAPTMERERFCVKRGTCWSSWTDPLDHTVRLPDLDGVHYSFHVDRSKFDDLLLKHAVAGGSRVLSGVAVDGVTFTDDGHVGGIAMRVGQTPVKLRSRVVVDASGRRALVGRQLQQFMPVTTGKRVAVSGWFRGVKCPSDETGRFLRIHVLQTPRTWMWQIPVDADVTSIGIVTDREELAKVGGDAARFLPRVTAADPVVRDRLARATPIAGLNITPNDSHTLKRFAGNGWLALGDAAFFVDPAFSLGLSIATQSAKRAADAIKAALDADDTSAARFADYDATLRAGEAVARDLVQCFYTAGDRFSALLTNPAYHGTVQRLCEGDVFTPDAARTVARFKQDVDAALVG